MLKMSIDQLLNVLNATWADCGSYTVMDDDMLSGVFQVQVDDIGIYYDYTSEDLNNEERDRLHKWLYNDPNGGWLVIRKLMSDNGYDMVIEDDGSGDGLYYGCGIFRKRAA